MVPVTSCVVRVGCDKVVVVCVLRKYFHFFRSQSSNFGAVAERSLQIVMWKKLVDLE